jgi:hypothetical protein
VVSIDEYNIFILFVNKSGVIIRRNISVFFSLLAGFDKAIIRFSEN